MPYISVIDKFQLDNHERGIKVAGELNYTITMLMLDYWKAHGSRYQQINDIVGALECAKLEFYARLARPYEDKAIERNGDVYPEEH